MLIDWFTVIAQIINFLVLVYLLNRFLYKPITKTMGERKKHLERHWQEAQAKGELAEQEVASYRQKQQELEQQRQALVTQAREQAEQERKHLVHQAREEVYKQEREWRADLERQQDAFLERLRQRVQQYMEAITRRALQDLANIELEHQMIAVFIDRLQRLDAQQRAEILKSIQFPPVNIVIRSSFDIPIEERQKIIDALQQQQITDGKSVDFLTSPELICGIDLQIENYHIAWSCDRYLKNLDSHFSMAFKS
ncbi:MAG: F0F1 ATP synthase subunit B [Leptolyngbyaceae bacterium]|nr:F0F1 ATP synthase subunit B [Leptolyngbyaceae bacterium]